MGNCYAKNNLGVIYLREEKYENAIVYFKEAIKEKNNTFSLYNLARIYYFGMGVDKNVDKAIRLLEKAANTDFHLDLFVLNLYQKSNPYLTFFEKYDLVYPISYKSFEEFDSFCNKYNYIYKKSKKCKNASSNAQNLTDLFYDGFDIKFE